MIDNQEVAMPPHRKAMAKTIEAPQNEALPSERSRHFEISIYRHFGISTYRHLGISIFRYFESPPRSSNPPRPEALRITAAAPELLAAVHALLRHPLDHRLAADGAGRRVSLPALLCAMCQTLGSQPLGEAALLLEESPRRRATHRTYASAPGYVSCSDAAHRPCTWAHPAECH